MLRPKDQEAESAFRLSRKLYYPLIFLLAMPLAVVIRGFYISGATSRNLFSTALIILLASLFLPWLTKKIVVSAEGIRSSTLFSASFIQWSEVTKVTGLGFRGRALIMIVSRGRRIMITDVIGNFKHLVGYVVEHASRAAIDEDVRKLFVLQGHTNRDALLLWLAVTAMALLTVLKLTRWGG